jgi:hypothetical protein
VLSGPAGPYACVGVLDGERGDRGAQAEEVERAAAAQDQLAVPADRAAARSGRAWRVRLERVAELPQSLDEAGAAAALAGSGEVLAVLDEVFPGRRRLVLVDEDSAEQEAPHVGAHVGLVLDLELPDADAVED